MRAALPRSARITAAALAGLVIAAGATTPASAGKATGSCTDGASKGAFATVYTVTAGWNRVQWFEFKLTNRNGLGNKSNVDIEHYQNITAFPDTLKYEWASADNVKPNVDYEHTPTKVAQTPVNKWAHTRFGFIFDNSLADDECNADTDNFR